MKQLQYAYMGSRYHKKTSLLIFMFFSIALLLLTLLTSLVSIEHLKFQQIRERWNAVQSALEHIKLDGFNSVVQADKQLMITYKQMSVILLCVFVFVSICIAVLCAHQRRKEIQSFFYLGVGYGHMVFQTILQVLFPMFFAFVCVISLLFLFQSSFSRALTAINANYFTDSYPNEMMIAGISADKGKDLKEQDPKTTINNFDDTSLFLPKQIEHETMRFNSMLVRASKGFAFLSLIFLTCMAITVFLYSFILYSRN